jgi:hypothetical protein
MGEHSADYKPNNRRGIMGSSEERQKEKKGSNSYKVKKGSTGKDFQKCLPGLSVLYVESNSLQMKRD